MKTKMLPFIAVSFMSIFIWSCGGSSKNEDKKDNEKSRGPLSWVRSIIGNFSAQDTVFLDSGYTKEFLTRYSKFKIYEKDITRFYKDRNNAYAWYEGNRVIEPAGNLFQRVKQSQFDLPADTLAYFSRFEELMDRPNRKANRQELELMLTSQYFALAHQVWKGLGDNATGKNDWYIPRKKISYSEYLDSMLTRGEGEFLESEPLNPQYQALKQELVKLKKIYDANPDWSKITAGKSKYVPGDTGAVIAEIRLKLLALGYINADSDSNVYDKSMESAVKAYQQHHGLEPDGIIGKGVIDELNIPLRKRMEKILVNMERARWLPVDYSKNDNYLLVNIPEFKLHVYEKNKLLWSSNVVVGEEVNKTVIFSGVMDHVVFSPHWNIPESIVKDEIMPSMEENPRYLEEQDLEITGERDGLPVIRQKPGKENSLGLVKFMFPNTHNIYLHDSPAKQLYNERERAFSHGCIRVAEAEKLAGYVLRDNSQWNESKIRDAMNSGDEKYVDIKTKLPVYLVYFTAWVDDDGILQFRKDIYDNDERLAQMIFKNGNSITTLVK